MKFFWYHVWLWRGRHFIFETSCFVFNEKDEIGKNKKKWVQELFWKWEENGGLNNLIQEIKPADTDSFLGKT